MRFVPLCLILVLAFSGCTSKENAEIAVLEGEVFVVTRGRENVKLALVQIIICETGVNAPTYPTDFVANTVTNSDGKFSVHLSKGMYRLFATATRSIPFGTVEKYEWVIDVNLVNDRQTIMLSNHNLSPADKWPDSLRRPSS